MRAIRTAELLNLWDACARAGPLRGALELLAAALPGLTVEALALEPIGVRDARLMELRALLFGPAVAAVTACPECGERLDLAFALDDLRPERPEGVGEGLRLVHDGIEIALRPPNSIDVATAPTSEGAERVRAHLLERCLSASAPDGRSVAMEDLPPEAIDRAVARMAEADPAADIQLDLVCPRCGREWSAVFDILLFLWGEIEEWAHATMADVHTLARAYGWSEAEVLALSPRRRGIYLTMATQ